MKHKIAQLNAAIQAEAAKLGLVFVNGPDTAPGTFDAQQPARSQTNGQERETYLFSVAEAA